MAIPLQSAGRALLLELVLLRILLTPVEAGSCVLSPVDAMVQITSFALPTPLAKPVASARGELVHVQALLTGSGSKALTAKSDSGSLGAPVTVRQMGYSDLNETFFPARPTGLYPAVLMPLTANSSTKEAEAGKPLTPTVFWLTVRIPRNATPGLHAVVLHVSGGDCDRAVETKRGQRSQTTGASFQVSGITRFNPPGSGAVPAPETALNFFRSMTDAGVDSFIFWEKGGWDKMPWAINYRFSKDLTGVQLNTSDHQLWWPRVLDITGSSTRWRMPFSNRVGGNTHFVSSNSNWTFNTDDGTTEVPIFAEGAAGVLNPTFEQMFRMLFGAVSVYLRSNGWEEHGSWIAVADEPTWSDPDTLKNSIALMELWHSISPSVKVYQTRWPDAGSGHGFPANCKPLLSLVDEWVAHAVQWAGPSCPEEMKKAKADRKAAGHNVLFTVYDNGVPITEAPNERTRFQALDVWGSNGTLDGTLSWYSIDTYVHDPWLNPFPGGSPVKPAGWGYELWPPAPGERDSATWQPRESVVWIMSGAGLQDVEYLYALQRLKHPSDKAKALIAQARAMAWTFPHLWFKSVSWGDDGYLVDKGGHADGSSVVNTWKLAMGAELDAELFRVIIAR